jgi:hypothetical protein
MPLTAAGLLLLLLKVLVRLAVALFGCYTAFEIRTYAIREYGPLIHECATTQTQSVSGLAALRRELSASQRLPLSLRLAALASRTCSVLPALRSVQRRAVPGRLRSTLPVVSLGADHR